MQKWRTHLLAASVKQRTSSIEMQFHRIRKKYFQNIHSEYSMEHKKYVYIVSQLCSHQNSIIRLVSAHLLLLRNSIENWRQPISSDRIYEIKLPTLHSVPDNMRMRYYSLLVVNRSTHRMWSTEEKSSSLIAREHVWCGCRCRSLNSCNVGNIQFSVNLFFFFWNENDTYWTQYLAILHLTGPPVIRFSIFSLFSNAFHSPVSVCCQQRLLVPVCAKW